MDGGEGRRVGNLNFFLEIFFGIFFVEKEALKMLAHVLALGRRDRPTSGGTGAWLRL